ncbi:MAG: EAL domain-containing protein [Synergistaceae bacterium]|nr:EAL domain-containing protein [Synergistaceae bacterium]
MLHLEKLLQAEKENLLREVNDIALQLYNAREPIDQLLIREKSHVSDGFVAMVDCATQEAKGYVSNAEHRAIPLSPLFSRNLTEAIHRLYKDVEGENSRLPRFSLTSGILEIGQKRYVVAVASILERGNRVAVVGYELETFLLFASRVLGENFQLLSTQDTSALSIQKRVQERIQKENDPHGVYVEFTSDTKAVVYYTLANMDMIGQDNKILISNDKERQINEVGLKTLANRYAWVFLSGVLTLALVLFIFDKLILYRLQKLQKIADDISSKWQVNLRIPLEGNDEITRLCMSFNAMLDALDMLISRVPDPLILSDPDGTILLVNAAARDLLGYREERALLGLSLRSILLEKGKNTGPVDEFLKSEGNVFEVNIRHADGGLIPAEIHQETLTFGRDTLTLSIAHDLTERKIIEDRLVKMAFYDSQTGLPNRHYFWDELEKELRNIKTLPNYTFCVVFINMDKFKLVNEQVGPRNADLVIIEAAKRITNIIAGFAASFRLSGDEFGIIIRGTTSKDYVKSLLLRIQRLLNTPVYVEGKTVFPSASFGVVLGIQATNTTNQILALGSDALIRGKKHGIGTITFLAAEEGVQKINHNLQHNLLTLRADMQKALSSSEFVAYFQPIYHLSPQRLAGFEALARWNHPEHGLLSPGAFIPQAEETGLITKIDKQIISQAIQAAKEWSKTFPDTDFLLSANASGASFKDPGFMPFVCERIQEESLDPRYFALEVTEGIFIDSLESAKEKLNQLRNFGVKIALDDFGTGYSSLQYVSQLPINYLKIDKSFIDQLFFSEKNSLMVRSIISMARDLNFDIVAEGIENENQLHWLIENNVPKGQGYFFSQPISLTEAENILADAKFFEGLL